MTAKEYIAEKERLLGPLNFEFFGYRELLRMFRDDYERDSKNMCAELGIEFCEKCLGCGCKKCRA